MATPTYGVGLNPQSIAMGDFNGDGKLDLAVANAGSTTLSLLLGNGDGTFQPARFVDAGGTAPVSVAVGDFNHDGKLDLAVATYGNIDHQTNATAGNTIAILLGNGDGTFQPAQTFTTGTGPFFVTVGDFNGDGKPDLAVANYGPNTQRRTTISVLMGNGDGTFQPAQTFGVGTGPTWMALGDFNRDGKQDLVVLNQVSNSVSVLLGNGDGTFQPAQNFAVGSGPWSVTVGDFNGDGIQDLAAANEFGSNVSVLLGNGDGTFQTGRLFAADQAALAVSVGDFNGDGKLDLAVGNLGTTTVSVLQGNGDGTFQAAQNFGSGLGPAFMAVADFNGDGKPDLAVANYYSPTISVLINNTGGSAAVATPTFSPGGGTYTGSVTVTISDATSGATIHYTTDGSTPTTSSPVYGGALTFTQTTTLKAMAAASGMTNSAVASATYTIQQQQVATPTFSPGGGTYTGSVTVTISDATGGATIHYTTDGSTPTTSSPVYGGALTFTQTTTLKAMAAASGMTNSGVASATYTVQQQQVATPTFSPGGGTYTGSVTVTINDATSGATIYYTTNGSTPTTSSAVYSGALTFTQTTTLKAMAAANGMSNSGVASATYTIQQQQVATPTFSPGGGTYTGSVTVTIDDATSGATIYYTTNGSTPTTSSAVYSGALTFTQTTT